MTHVNMGHFAVTRVNTGYCARPVLTWVKVRTACVNTGQSGLSRAVNTGQTGMAHVNAGQNAFAYVNTGFFI